MTQPIIGVIQFPGSNCERETKLAIKRSGMFAKDVFWNSSLTLLDECDGYIIVGGFSFEDRLRSGVIAALNPIIKSLTKQSEKLKPILGICNGAQILLESGLVPGLKDNKLGAALYTNKRQINGNTVEGGFYNDWCDIKPKFINSSHAFTNQFKENVSINIPFAHGQGRFVLSEELYQEMIDNECSFFQYQGENPNGSIHNLAAISNKNGNVMAMMPHPERTEFGDVIFSSMREFILEKPKQLNPVSHYGCQPIKNEITLYESLLNSQEIIIDLLIEDKVAKSLEMVLKQNNFKVSVNRYKYWSIDSEYSKNELMTKITDSAELFNSSKEQTIELKDQAMSFLVRDQDDVLGRQKTKNLQTIFGMAKLKNISQGTIFSFDIQNNQAVKLNKFLKETHLLFNPYVQDCYEYNQI